MKVFIRRSDRHELMVDGRPKDVAALVMQWWSAVSEEPEAPEPVTGFQPNGGSK